ncbi:MAG TPA: hypothetical protein DCS64_15040, partial [Algoriphagus sp.]|nr:hypothetical protein [Algoriphagus sp.]
MNSKNFLFALLIFLIPISSFAQDEDIFGISRKAKNPKSESSVGNLSRNILEMFAVEISGGAAYHQFGTSFFSENPSLYPLTQFQNFEEPLDISEENPLVMRGNDWTAPLFNAGLRINVFNLL